MVVDVSVHGIRLQHSREHGWVYVRHQGVAVFMTILACLYRSESVDKSVDKNLHRNYMFKACHISYLHPSRFFFAVIASCI